MSEARIERHYLGGNHHPAIVAVGQSCQSETRKGFPLHRHSFTEISLVTRGSIGYYTEDDHYTLTPNSIQISQPNQWHGTTDNFLNPCTFTWVQLRTSELKTPELEKRINSIPYRLNRGANVLLCHLEAMLAECRDLRSDTSLALHGHLHLFLVHLARIANEINQTEYPTTLTRALKYLDKGREEEPTVAKLAQVLNTHRSYLYSLFVKHLGITPQAYIKEKRFRRAADLLTSSKDSITDIAFELNFASAQHFATAFRKRYGLSPAKFRAQVFI